MKAITVREHPGKLILQPDPDTEAAVMSLTNAERADDLVIVDHTIDITKFLRNLGWQVPAPIMRQYKWPGPKPFRIQRLTAALLTMNRRAYVLSEMGTGKTRSALFAADFLLQQGIAKTVLIVAPLSTLSQVWDRELLEFFGDYQSVVLHGSREKRRSLIGKGHQFLIINHDGIGVVAKELATLRPDVIIIDEASAYRNPQTDRWKAIAPLVATAKYVWALTGSPAPNSPTDAWGLAKLLTPNRVPKYFGHFRQEVMTKITTFKWIPKSNAIDRVYEVLQPAVRFTRDDCVELPEVSYVDRKIDVSPEVDRVYKGLIAQLSLDFAEGRVTAANEGVLCSKLLQVSAGWVYTKTREVVSLDNKGRLDALEELIEEAGGKVLVFADFTHAAESIAAELERRKVPALLVTGSIPLPLRNEAFNAFNSKDGPRVLVAHPKCMSHGLNLTVANVIVWFTPTSSLETYEQACARITRPGQQRKQLIVHLVGTPMERRFYGRLRQKASLQGALLEMFNEAQE